MRKAERPEVDPPAWWVGIGREAWSAAVSKHDFEPATADAKRAVAEITSTHQARMMRADGLSRIHGRSS